MSDRHRTPWSLAAVLCAFVVVTTAPASPTAAAQPVPVLVVEGRGFGHGVGMAQDGAYWMGVAGATTDDILGHFYAGTERATSGGIVRVGVLEDAGPSVVVTFPDGGEVRDGEFGAESPGFPVSVGPGGEIELSLEDGRYRARALSGVTGPPPTEPVPESEEPLPADGSAVIVSRRPPEPVSTAPLWAVPAEGSTVSVPIRGRRYRGVIEARAAGDGLRLLNHLDVEQYLRGMGEVLDPGWPAASLQAQAIAARTYALVAMATAGELCDTERCQVYLGQSAEYGAMDLAVANTDGQVVTYGGALANTVYSANAGGISATNQEGFGIAAGGDVPYLRAAPYTTQDPMQWTVRVELSEVRRRVGYPGDVSSVAISRPGPSGRAIEVTVEGTSGATVVDGQHFTTALGLRSNLFTLRIDKGTPDPPPPPPPPHQAPPRQVTPLQALVPRPVTPAGVASAPARRPIRREAGDPSARWPAVVAIGLVILNGAGLYRAKSRARTA